MTAGQPEPASGESPGAPGLLARALSGLLSCHDLPDPPPLEPMALLQGWLHDAAQSGRYDDPSAMTLATATPGGAPSARIVLCKAIEPAPPALLFFTNYQSRKGRELEINPHAAALFHWPHAKRQARVEGCVERVTAAQSDEYFRSRPLLSRIGATISPQSQPIASRAELVASAMAAAAKAARSGELPRPSHWGGYRLHAGAVELWSARDGRLHDRVLWTRKPGDGPAGWSVTRLGP